MAFKLRSQNGPRDLTVGVSLSANKYAGQKAGVGARVTYRF